MEETASPKPDPTGPVACPGYTDINIFVAGLKALTVQQQKQAEKSQLRRIPWLSGSQDISPLGSLPPGVGGILGLGYPGGMLGGGDVLWERGGGRGGAGGTAQGCQRTC